jgi:putative ABC transport system permease protein
MRFAQFVWKNLLRRKFRSALTTFGVAAAIAAVVALLGVSQGFEESLREVYDSRGIDLIVLRAGVSQANRSRMDESYGSLLRKLPHIKSVSAALMEMEHFTADASDVMGNTVHGWPPDSELFHDLDLVSGEKIQGEKTGQIMLGEDLAKKLDKHIGQPVEIQDMETPFECVGIFRAHNIWENGSAVISLLDMQKRKDLPGIVSEFQLVLKRDVEDREQVMAELQMQVEKITDENGKNLGLAAITTDDFLRSNNELQLARAMAWSTSITALIIGSIGVLNTMIMSVLERTQEIGILRAIGWKRRRIVRMIMSESFSLCAVGAVLGIFAAVLAIRAVSHLPQLANKVRSDISWTTMGIGLIMAVLVGLVGGAYPAIRGASLPPTEALRYE